LLQISIVTMTYFDSALKLGFGSSLLAFLGAVSYCVVQILQLLGIVHYPVDAILIYSTSLIIAPSYLIAVVALHYVTAPAKQLWSLAALVFAIMYAVFCVFMYTIQLVTVIPLSLKNTTENILTVKPQSFFWTVDGLGYICLGISTMFASFTFRMHNSEKAIKQILFANGLLVPVISFVYFYPHFSTRLLALAFPWVITVPGSFLLLSLFFRGTSIKYEPGQFADAMQKST